MARYERFVVWQWIIGILHFGGALLIAFLVQESNDWTVPVHVTYNVWERTAGSQECTTSAPCSLKEYRSILPNQLSLGSCVALFSVFSGIHHIILAAAPIFSKEMIATGVNPVRWADYALSASLMLMVNAVLWAAPPDLQTLTLWFAVQFTVVAAGYGSEVAWSLGGRAHSVAIFVAASIAFFAVWIVSWYTFAVSIDGDASAIQVGSVIKDTKIARNDPPVFVYALLGWIFLSFSLFPAVHGAKLCRDATSCDTDMLNYEVYYGFLSLFSKLPLLAVYASGVIGRSDRVIVGGNLTPTTNPEPESATATLLALGITATGCILFGFIFYLDMVWYRNTGICGATGRQSTHIKTYDQIMLVSLKH